MKNFLGKRLDNRYEFLELIGVGGMADVYKAYDEVKKCYVAIKVLKEKFLGNKEFLYKFRNESKANASLSHPNIVRVFDVGFGNKIQYIVMEYIEGVTLKDFIEKAKVLNWKDVIHFTFQILRGLQHAHDKGIVHRDMKPQNIMLLEDGTVKIMDFGIARFPRDEKINLKKTVGSVHYISPEQASGGITDFKSDIYSVGIMMYEMVAGELPFTGKTPEIVLEKQLQEPPRSLLDINPNIPRGLCEIIFRAIKKNPHDRYQSADEMLRDINEFKKNPQITFGYKNVDDIERTRYFNFYENGPRKIRNLSSNKKNRFIKNKSNFLPILFGVASAFLLVSIVLVLTFIFGRKKNIVTDIEIPNFVGKNIEDVKTMENGKYKDLGFTVNYEPNSKFDAGVIIDQSVKPGMQVKSNYSNITFTVSSGVEIKTLPNVVGLPVSKAEAKLKKIGFINIKKVDKIDEQAAPNVVIGMEPRALIQVAYDTQIILYVNSRDEYEKIAEVPSVVGQSLDEARLALKSAGFDVTVKYINDNTKTFDVVVAQSKEKAVLGSTIEITLNVNDSKYIDKHENFGGHKSLKSNGVSVKIPLKSSVKLNDGFHVYVTEASSNKVVHETEYSTQGVSSIDLKVDSNKNSDYIVTVKNNSTGKTARYGIVKVSYDEYGNMHPRASFSPDAFSKTLN